MLPRIKRLQDCLKGNEEILITSYYNLLYFCGLKVHAGERMLALVVKKDQKPILITNELFGKIEAEDTGIISYRDEDDPIAILASVLDKETVYVDDQWTSAFLIRLMDKHQAEYRNAGVITKALRLVKDEEEQERMIQASLDNDEVMRRIRPFIRLGVSEKEIYNKLLELFEKLTHEPVSFTPIVAFGKNAADPHHTSDNTVLKEGDVCLIDMGSHYKDYCSDMTRTFLQKNPKMEEIYGIVKNANIAAEKAIRPGMKYREIDAVARDLISSYGYGQYFTHRLGHGIGLEVHEGYDVSSSDEEIVLEGHCFSIEPGIYLPDVGGVRIEDLVIVTKDGCKVLNSYSKEADFFE